MDEVEETLGVSLEEASPSQLLFYFEEGVRRVVGIKVANRGMSQVSTMKTLQKTYGSKEAAEIVRWAVNRWKCRFNGEVMTASSFALGNKWLTDKIYSDLQLSSRSKKEKSDRDRDLKASFTSLEDILRGI